MYACLGIPGGGVDVLVVRMCDSIIERRRFAVSGIWLKTENKLIHLLNYLDNFTTTDTKRLALQLSLISLSMTHFGRLH